MNSTLERLLVTLVAVLVGPWGVTAQSVAVAITNVTIIDGTGSAPRPNTTVIVNGGRITTVGGASRVRVPQDAIVVDGNGKFLIPGL